MAQGLQIWDASGTMILDATDRLGRFLGVFDVTDGQNGSLTNAALTTGTLFYHMTTTVDDYANHPAITVSGTTLYWTWATPGHARNRPVRITYGVY